MTNAGRIETVELEPRDGLQNESTGVSTTDKIDLIARAASFRWIEAASFANPRRGPERLDIEDFAVGLAPYESGTHIVFNAIRHGFAPLMVGDACADCCPEAHSTYLPNLSFNNTEVIEDRSASAILTEARA